MKLSKDYNTAVKTISNLIGLGRSYDIIKRDITIENLKLSFFFIDGFVKDSSLQDLIKHYLYIKRIY